MRPDRWQFGSDFHASDEPWSGGGDAPWRTHTHALFGLARDAILAVASRSGTLWAPTYFCHEVLRWLLERGARVELYPDGPLTTPPVEIPGARRGDTVLAVSYLGLRRAPTFSGLPEGVTVVEDHTHDPWSSWARSSRAQYVLASLRKSMPVPDGAVLWSPRGEPIPPVPSPDADRSAGALLRLTGMVLKGRFLRGEAVDRAAYRAALLGGEEALERGGSGSPCAYTTAALDGLGIEAGRARRRQGLDTWRRSLDGAPGIALPLVEVDAAAAPFAVAVRLRSRRERDRVRSALIAAEVFPAVLWSLDRPIAPVPASHAELAETTFCLPVDARYTDRDIERAAARLRECA